MSNIDKAGVAYWDNVWKNTGLPGAVDPNNKSFRNYVRLLFHNYFSNAFAGLETSKMRLLEIGCARSEWLPYFAQQYGFEIWGLDYSEIGCQQSRKILENEDVSGEIILGDAFDPPLNMLGMFDVVISFGVIEHFENTATALESFAKFLKPNGLLLTTIPNLTGLIGQLQKYINRPIFDIHIPLNADQLSEAHQKANLIVIDTSYSVYLNLWVLNLQNAQLPKWQLWPITLARFFMSVFTRFLERLKIVSVSKHTASYIFCTAKVPPS